jgi:hypothetical protein
MYVRLVLFKASSVYKSSFILLRLVIYWQGSLVIGALTLLVIKIERLGNGLIPQLFSTAKVRASSCTSTDCSKTSYSSSREIFSSLVRSCIVSTSVITLELHVFLIQVGVLFHRTTS